MTWSSVDLAGHCRADIRRTAAFEKAISCCVVPGEVVVEVGAGSGVLSMFASRNGARRVVAVESDLTTFTFLQRGLKKFHSTIELLHGDACSIELPVADVVIAELIDVWLLEEDFARVVSNLATRGTITRHTKIIPSGYEFNLDFGIADWKTCCPEIPWPQYQWPIYDHDGWEKASFEVCASFPGFHAVLSRQIAAQSEREIDITLYPPTCQLERLETANAMLLSGTLQLWESVQIFRSESVNAPLMIPIESAPRSDWEKGLRVQAVLSGGIRSLRVTAGNTVVFAGS